MREPKLQTHLCTIMLMLFQNVAVVNLSIMWSCQQYSIESTLNLKARNIEGNDSSWRLQKTVGPLLQAYMHKRKGSVSYIYYSAVFSISTLHQVSKTKEQHASINSQYRLNVWLPYILLVTSRVTLQPSQYKRLLYEHGETKYLPKMFIICHNVNSNCKKLLKWNYLASQTIKPSQTRPDILFSASHKQDQFSQFLTSAF